MQATGMGAVGPERSLPNPGVAPPANLSAAITRSGMSAADSISVLLSELSQLDLSTLLDIVDAPLGAADEAQAGALLSAAEEAAAVQNPGRALDLLRQLASIDPARAESLLSSPALASIRPAVEQMLNQMTAAAKLHAEGRLVEASQKFESTTFSATFKDPGEVRPEIFLPVAIRLMEAGGLANYVRSAAISAILIDQVRWAPVSLAAPPADGPAGDRYGSLWLLLSVWFAMGIASAGLCWWIRYDYLPIVCGAWVSGLVLMILAVVWRRPPRS